MDFTGKVAVVTGGARGIGRAIVDHLARSGASIAILDRNKDEAAIVADELVSAGHPTLAIGADVSNWESVETAAECIVSHFGQVDILVNNAGIAGTSVKLWEQTIEDWDRIIAIDLTGVFYCCKAFVPHMLARHYGRIVNVSSIAGKEGNPLAAPYSAAKAGVMGLTKSLGKELATEGILVNCVTPAVIMTPILEQVSQEHLDYMVSRIPMGRTGKPEEVAELVLWLASDACSFSTGAVFDISGGRATY